MANEMSIEDFQNELQELLTSDPDSFSDNIDKFNIDNLIDYWNVSVQEFYDKLKNFFEIDELDSTDVCNYNAATRDKNYVGPFINKNEENYLEARNDEIKDALENYDKMDFTSGDYKSITSEIKKYITKLIMPQNSRYVEVEDLNRNFWVISYNLTLLNDLAINFGNDFVKCLTGELTGLWDNVYRIWQALYYLNNQIDKVVKNEKLHVSIKYDSTIIPYIRTAAIGDRTVNYIVYNEYINSIFEKTQEELIPILTSKDNIVYIDYNNTKQDLRVILKMLQEKNFVLVSFGNVNQNTQWDLLSLSFTNEVAANTDFTINKLIRTQHLWIDFVSQNLSCGAIVSYTENNFGNQKELLSYDYELTIPITKNCECKYEDFIRFNKPYPNLQKIVYTGSSIDRINSLKDNNNWIGYEDDRTAVDGTYGFIDGFYGLDLSQYPTEENINIDNYPNCFKFSPENLFPTHFASSDLISTQHNGGGQSKIINRHGNSINNISINLRYINGHNSAQEVEIITTKDAIGGASQRFKNLLSAENVYLGGIYNNNPDGVESPDDTNYYLKFSLANNYRTNFNAESIYRAPANITEDDTNTFWVPIRIVKDKEREKKGQANSIDVVKIWNDSTLRSAIIERVKEVIGQLRNYEYRIVNTHFSCFVAGTDGNVGPHYSHLLLVYREMGDVCVEEICPLDYSVCFFNGSSLNDMAKTYSQEQGNEYTWSATDSYCAATLSDGYISYYSDAFLTLEGLSIEGGTQKSITINKMTIGLFSSSNKCYEIWGKVANKKWTIEGAKGTPLKEYTLSESLDSIERNEASENLYVGRIDENSYVHIEETDKKLYNSPTDYLSPWSNPKNGIGWKEWGYQPGV